MANDVSINVTTKDGASAGLGKIAANTESMTTRAGKAIDGLGQKIGGELGELVSTAGDGLERLGKQGVSMGTKLAVAGGAIAGVGLALGSLGSADKAAEQQLSASVSAVGESVDDYSKQIDAAVSKGEDFGHSSADVSNALNTLVTKTGDLSTALAQMGLVEDLAAAKHESLNSAATQVGQAIDGNTRLFKQYGIAVQAGTQSTAQINDELTQLAGKLNGQAAAATDTFSGKIDSVKEHVLGFLSTVGNEVAGPMTFLGTALGIAGSAYDILGARSERAAAKEIELAEATRVQGASAGTATAANGELAASEEVVAGSADAAGASMGRSRLASAGAVTGIIALGVGAYYAGNAISSYTEKNNTFAHAMEQSAGDMKNFTAALEQDSGVVGDNAKASTLAAVTNAGFGKSLVNSKLTLSDVTNAVMDNNTEFNALVATWLKGKEISGNQAVALGALHNEFEQGLITAQQYTAAQKQLGITSTLTTTQIAALVAPLDQTAKSFTDGENALSDFQAKMAAAQPTALQAQQTIYGFEDSVASLSTQLKTNGDSFLDNSATHRQNAESLLGLIDNINTMSQASVNAGDSAQQTSAKTQQWNQDLLATAGNSKQAKAEIQGMINQYEQSPKTFAYQMVLNVQSVLDSLGSVDDQLNYLGGLEKTDLGAYDLLKGSFNQFTTAQIKEGGQEHGGIVGAASGRIVNGMTWVGEHGPELADLAPGTQVHSNPDSMRMAAQQGAGSGVSVTFASPGGSLFEQAMMAWLRQAVRVQGGGDVQKAFGN